MTGKLELYVVLILFLWAISVWVALLSLSLGKIRRIEEKDKELSELLNKCFEKREEYEIILRFIIFFTAGIITVHSFIIYTKLFANYSQYLIIILSSTSTFILLIIVELFAGTLGHFLNMAVLKFSVPFLNFLRKTIFMPVIFAIMTIRRRINYLKDPENDLNHTSAEDEILSLIEGNKNANSENLDESERKMIKGVFTLDDKVVREIMTPRVDVIGIEAKRSVIEAKKVFIESGHSRLPLFEGNIDKILGVLYAKDLLDEEKIRNKKLVDIARPPIFMPETNSVSQVLEELKRKSNHFAVIIDEYGGTAGIVTLEDIIEEIVGEIGDEYDTGDDILPDNKRMPDGSVIFDGRALISDLKEIFDDINLNEFDGIDTVGGYISAYLGRIPESGEKINLNNCFEVAILKADKRKIIKLKMSRIK